MPSWNVAFIGKRLPRTNSMPLLFGLGIRLDRSQMFNIVDIVTTLFLLELLFCLFLVERHSGPCLSRWLSHLDHRLLDFNLLVPSLEAQLLRARCCFRWFLDLVAALDCQNLLDGLLALILFRESQHVLVVSFPRFSIVDV